MDLKLQEKIVSAILDYLKSKQINYTYEIKEITASTMFKIKCENIFCGIIFPDKSKDVYIFLDNFIKFPPLIVSMNKITYEQIEKMFQSLDQAKQS